MVRQLIQSKENPKFKQWLKPQRHTCWLEGPHLIEACLAMGGTLEVVVYSESAQHQYTSYTAAQEYVLADHLFQRLSHVPSPQGVMARYRIPSLPSACITHNCVVLDRIQDPGNLGTILRTALAVGIEQVFISTGSVFAWHEKVLRSAQGAHFGLQIHTQVDLPQLLAQSAIPVYATTLHDAQDVYTLALPRTCAWLMGNEGQGIDPNLLHYVDQAVLIPHAAQVESLNVAIATALVLFEQKRQHVY